MKISDSAPRRLGRLTVSAAVLERALGLPPGHHVVEAVSLGGHGYGTFELVIEGRDMPPVSAAGVPQPVQLNFRQQSAVMASWSHTDGEHPVAPGVCPGPGF